MFLVRESTNFPGDYTLCVSYAGKVEHYHIIYRNNLLTIDEEEMFDTLAKLVEVHWFFYSILSISFLIILETSCSCSTTKGMLMVCAHS